MHKVLRTVSDHTLAQRLLGCVSSVWHPSRTCMPRLPATLHSLSVLRSWKGHPSFPPQGRSDPERKEQVITSPQPPKMFDGWGSGSCVRGLGTSVPCGGSESSHAITGAF